MCERNRLLCVRGHSFDIARQGHVSLVGGDARPVGDDAAMVKARDDFLGGGWYAPVAAALADAARTVTVGGAVLDVGAGTGWYLAAVLDRVPTRAGLAIDSSRYAARRAARCHPRAGAVVADAWRGLPVRSAAAAVILDVFAPRNGTEMARVLAPGGALLVVTPTPRHLRELAEPLELLDIHPHKTERLVAELGPELAVAESEEIEFTMTLHRSTVGALAAMGPSAHHTSTSERDARVAALPDEVAVTASVTLHRFVRGR